jgi:myo-inositol-1(or 4)-monophosphatase
LINENRAMPDRQLLHLVIGGELKGVGEHEFRDLEKVDFVGAFPNYADAHRAWKAKAQSTVDNALTRYFIIHAHKLLDPDEHHDESKPH